MAKWVEYATYVKGMPHTVVGTVLVRPRLRSEQLGNTRALFVYLPPGYAEHSRRYPVLYMHDGQNLFDAPRSYAGEWQVDETCQRLAGEGLELIVVGIPNAGEQRMREYAPFRNGRGDKGRGDEYLAFVVELVKPLIDRSFRTLPGRENTAILGSSMGGLISLYAGFACHETFGLVGAMSPSLWFGGMAMFPYVRRAPRPTSRFYLDVGTREGSSSAVDRMLVQASPRRYQGNAFRMNELLIAKGYQPGVDLVFIEELFATHHESAWARRLPNALRFLFG